MFEAHGDYSVKVTGKILYIDAYDPWNYEAAINFCKIVKENITTYLKDVEWSMFANLYGESVYTHDSLPILKELHSWRIKHGLRYIAIINNKHQNSAASITKTQFDGIYETDYDHVCIEEYFENLENARLWLLSKGFGIG